MIDFFAPEYKKENIRNDAKFGICDNGTFAYTDSNSENDDKWIAEVSNPSQHDALFTPIDHNIIIKDEYDNDISLCDGMMTIDETFTLIFIELKIWQSGSWITDAVAQLESTISVFNENHKDLKKFKIKEAYAVNRKHPCFQYSHRQDMQTFKNKWGFRLNIVAKIGI